MSRAAFSRMSGIGEATLNRWENGLLVQNRANDRFLRLLASPENVRKLQSLDSERTRPGTVHADRFRAIHVSEQLRQQQASFRIQCVAWAGTRLARMYTTTFHSFKGGVGRSMALANVAVELANRGPARPCCRLRPGGTRSGYVRRAATRDQRARYH